MSPFISMMMKTEYQDKMFTLYPQPPKQVHRKKVQTLRWSKNDFDSLMELLHEECQPPLIFRNRVYQYQDLVMLLGNRKHREQFQKRQLGTGTINDYLVMITEKRRIDREEFPIINQYDAEYEETVHRFRKGPITISLTNSPNGGYGVEISFKIIPQREHYLDNHLQKVLEVIARCISSTNNKFLH